MKTRQLCSSRFKIHKAEHGSATTWSGCSRAKPIAHTGYGIVTIISLLLGVLQFFVLQAGMSEVFAQQTPLVTPFPPNPPNNTQQASQPVFTQPNITPTANNTTIAAQPSQPPIASSEPLQVEFLDELREIYVPEDELKSIFDAAKNNLLIKRSEFDELRKKAREVLLEIDRNKTRLHSPVEAVLLASDYKVVIADLRAVVEGEIEIEILTDDVVMIPFQVDRVSIIEAMDMETEKPAALEIREAPPTQQAASVRNTQTVSWILQGKKRHKMKIVATTPLEIDSTRQRIAFKLPYGVKNSLRLTIPGDVELKSGASVISRKVDKQTDDKNVKTQTTQFELLPKAINNLTDITMSLNSHRIGSYQAVLARSIQFAEITEQYERLHATVSLTEMHQGISEAAFEIPAGFEITDVASVLLDKWVVEKGEKNGDGKTAPDKLKLKFREQLPGLVTIHLSGIKVNKLSRDKVTDWRFPLFNPVNVATNSTVLGLLIEQELEMTDLESNKLYPIDPLMLNGAIPPSALNMLPGSPLIRLAAAWYAPQDQFEVKANFKPPTTDCSTESREILVLTDKTPVLRIDYAVTANTGKIFETIIEMPASWKISSIIGDQKMLEFRDVNTGNVKTGEGNTVNTGKIDADKRQIIVQFPRGIIPGETFRFALSATAQIDKWFTAEDEKKIQYPLFNIVGAKNVKGNVGILYGCEEDWEVVPVADGNLIPLDESVRQNLFPPINTLTEPIQMPNGQLIAQPIVARTDKPLRTVLAYEYLAKPFALELKLEKLQPRLNVKAVSIYSFAPTLLHVNHELWFTAKHASTKHVTFLLPIDTPNTISIAKISNQPMPPIILSGNSPIIQPMPDGSMIKETFSSEVEIEGKKYRRWEILLTKPQADLLKLNVNFEIQIEQDKNNTAPQPFKLPGIIAENAVWQSDIIAIQGDEELDLHVITDANTANVANTNNTANNTTKVGGEVNVLRAVDVGTIAGMYCQPGKRLIGVYSVLRDGGDVVVTMQRNQLLSLVTAAVENVTITALLGDSSGSGTLYSVLYDICTDGASMKLTLGDNDEIWSVKLDGQTIQPQRVGNDILIPIQQQLKTNPQENSQQTQNPNNRLRKLELVYRNHDNPLKNIRLSFPSLKEKRSGKDIVVPVMQTQWGVIPPHGYEVKKIGDNVIEQTDHFNPAVFKIFNAGAGFVQDIVNNETSFPFNVFGLFHTYRAANISSTRSESPTAIENNFGLHADEDGVLAPAYEDRFELKEDDKSSSFKDKKSDSSTALFDGNGTEMYGGMTQFHVPKSPQSSSAPVGTTPSISDTISITQPEQKQQRILRLKSVQPVTVVIAQNFQPQTGYSLTGTKNVQEIPVKISRSANSDLWG
ncbi:MAG: hypothetical protein LBL39_04775, partial [Planctomycetaceae bacterium]|nr:hypothetical protein [Planctomycetaceae bacterium]